MRLVSISAVALVLLSCSNVDEDDPQSSVLGLFEQNYLNALFEFRPTLAARLGLRQYEGRLDTVTQLATSRRIDQLKRQLVRLQNLRQEPLTRDEFANARLIDYRIRAEMVELEHVAGWKNNPAVYYQIPFRNLTYLVNRDFAPESERLRAVVISLHEMGAVAAAMRGNVRETTPEFGARSLQVAEQLRQLLHHELPPWAEEAAGVDMALRGSFQAAVSGAQDTLDMSTLWVQNGLAANARGTSALGSEAFVMKLLFEEMLAIPLEQLIELGELRLDRNYRAFVAQAGQMDPTASPRKVLERVTADRVAEGDVVQRTKEMVDAAHQILEQNQDIPVPQNTLITVALAPVYLRDGYSVAWMDLPGPGPERAVGRASTSLTQGILFVAPPGEAVTGSERDQYLRRLNQWDLQLAVLYEALPGRYLKTCYGLQSSSRPRRMLATRSAVDGWASYAEGLMVDSGFGNRRPELRLCHLRRRLVENCRLLASIKYHTQGMTLAEAEQMFVEKAFQKPASARLEALQAVHDPTYFAGMLGRLKIQALLEEYRLRMGAGFSLRQFHEEYLSLGPIPLPLARQLMLPAS
ncbi:MAG: DUF885 domain-containing protein [bacterium]|nr:DUF885 domain-containing protein [bacterium]